MPKLNHADLAHFTGSSVRFTYPLNRFVLYSEGVQYVAEHGEAYWLIDQIALYLGTPAFRKACAADPRIAALHFWTLTVAEDYTAVLSARADSDVPPFETNRIDITDFPLSSIDIWAGFDGRYWTLYLPSEH